MANHRVSIRKAGPARVPSLTQAQLSQGDTLEFVADEDADTILCFSAALAGSIDPAPVNRNVELTGGAAATFQVGTVKAGNYVVALQTKGFQPPSFVSEGTATDQALLLVRPAGALDFPEPPEPGSGT